MILSDIGIHKAIEEKKLVIEPFKKEAVQPASVDFHLGRHYLVIEDNEMSSIDLSSPVKYREIESDKVVIPPHSFLLATTQEYIRLPANITAFVEGRSSVGRIGLFIQNAGWVDPGFEGKITLELYNANSLPIKLDSGRRICQVVFCQTDQPVKNPYHGKYKGQTKTVGSKIHQDREVTNSE